MNTAVNAPSGATAKPCPIDLARYMSIEDFASLYRMSVTGAREYFYPECNPWLGPTIVDVVGLLEHWRDRADVLESTATDLRQQLEAASNTIEDLETALEAARDVIKSEDELAKRTAAAADAEYEADVAFKDDLLNAAGTATRIREYLIRRREELLAIHTKQGVIEDLEVGEEITNLSAAAVGLGDICDLIHRL